MNRQDSRPALSPAQRKELRALAHHLKPVVMIGDGGLTEGVIAETDRALTAHELIKVRVLGDDRLQRQQHLDMLCERLGCAPVQTIGKLLVLWRQAPDPDDPFASPARKAKPSGPSIPKKRLEARSEGRSQARAAGRSTPLAAKKAARKPGSPNAARATPQKVGAAGRGQPGTRSAAAPRAMDRTASPRTASPARARPEPASRSSSNGGKTARPTSRPAAKGTGLGRLRPAGGAARPKPKR